MTPRRYLSTTQQRLTTDNRGSDHAENMHDEIHALRKALRDMTAWNERLHQCMTNGKETLTQIIRGELERQEAEGRASGLCIYDTGSKDSGVMGLDGTVDINAIAEAILKSTK